MPVAPVSPSIINLERLFNLPPTLDDKLKLFLVKPKPHIQLHVHSSKKVYVWHYSPDEAIALALSFKWLDSNENSLTTQHMTFKEILPPSVPCVEEVF